MVTLLRLTAANYRKLSLALCDTVISLFYFIDGRTDVFISVRTDILISEETDILPSIEGFGFEC